MALPNCPVPLDQQKQELIQVLEAIVEVSQEGIGLIQHAHSSQEAKEISNQRVDLLFLAAQLHQTSAKPLQQEENRLQSAQLQQDVDECEMFGGKPTYCDIGLGLEEGESAGLVVVDDRLVFAGVEAVDNVLSA